MSEASVSPGPDARLAALLEDCLERARRGETVDVDALAGGSPELAEALRAGLQSLEFLDRARDALAPGAPPGLRTLGDYRILREVGRGGMGVVYEAEQISMPRRVALKVLPFAAVLDPRQVQRFRNEALAASQMHHSNIVPVFAVGCERGVHFYAMQFIEGESLAHAVRTLRRRERTGASDAADATSGSTPLSTAGDEVARVRLVAGIVAQAADALAYAHHLGLVHRDVKPANLMLDRAGHPWITDFGLVRLPAEAGLTRTGDLVGTVRYMSPEQARRLPTDHRTDVYSLGATLYELLALEAAFPGDDPKEVLQSILATEPRPLSRVRPAVPRDLETIVMRAMAKEPAHRYATADEMAQDLRRFGDGLPIRARRPSLAQRAGAWGRRHRALVAGAAALLVLAVAALVAGTVLLSREEGRTRGALETARRERAAAGDALVRARMRGLENASALALDTDPALALLLASEAARLDWTPRVAGALRDALAAALERTRVVHAYPPAVVAGSPTGDAILTVEGEVGSVHVHDASGRRRFVRHLVAETAAFSPTGDRVLAASREDVARVLDASGNEVATLAHPGRLASVAWSADGRRVLTATADGTARLWTAEGTALGEWRAPSGAWAAATFAPPRDTVLLASRDGALLRPEDGRTVDRAPFPLRALLVSPSGDALLATSDRGAVVLLAPDGRARATLADAGARLAVFAPTGERVAAVSSDGAVRIWDREGAAIGELRAHAQAVTAVAFSPDGRRILTASRDRTARVADLDGRSVAVFRGHADAVVAAAWMPDGERVVTASADRTVRAWDARPAEPLSWRAHAGTVTHLAFSADGARILSAARDGTASIRSVDRGVPAEIARHGGAAIAAFLPGGGVVTAGADGAVATRDADGSPRATRSAHAGPVTAVATSPAGDVRATGSADGTVVVWSADGEERARLSVGAPVTCLALSPAGDAVAVGGPSHLSVWSTDGRRTASPRPPRDEIRSLAWSPRGDRLLGACRDAGARLWSPQGEGVALLSGHEGPLLSAAWSQDGSRILTVARDRAPRLWTADGRPVVALRGHALAATSGAFSPSGDRVVTTAEDGTARLWDLDGNELDVLRVPSETPTAAAVSSRGDLVATGGADGAVRLWLARREDLLVRADARRLRGFTRAEREQFRDLLGPDNRLVLEAEARVAALAEEVVLRDDVIARLREDRDLPEDLRDAALAVAAARTDDADVLNRDAWAVVRTAEHGPDEFRHALKLARAANRLVPDDLNVLNTLGVALYRTGDLDAAVATLERSHRTRAESGRVPIPEDLAFLAMAYRGLGRDREAQDALASLRTVVEPLPPAAGARSFLAEAETLFAAPAPGR